jgi:hypothetical protein
MRSWKSRDYVVAAAFVVLGFALSRVLPEWLWGGIAVAGFIGSLWLSARQNRRRQHVPPGWTPGPPPNPN